VADRRGLRIVAVAGAIGLAILGLAVWGRGRGPWVAPDFSAPNLDGQAMRLSAYRGQVVLVSVWATWCPPCREEMPSMERLYQKLADRGFVILAVSQDETGADGVKTFVDQTKVTFPVLLDPDGDVGRSYGVWGYPESFLVDRTGGIVEHVVGPREWDAPAQVAAIERLMASDPQAAAP
jgi:peroxiredoxin